MVKVTISPLARADLREIADYIEHRLQNPSAALNIIRRLRSAILSLGSYPKMGSSLLVSDKPDCPYRYLVCGSYMVFYHISNDAVRIDRVLYGRRDYLTILFSDQLSEE